MKTYTPDKPGSEATSIIPEVKVRQKPSRQRYEVEEKEEQEVMVRTKDVWWAGHGMGTWVSQADTQRDSQALGRHRLPKIEETCVSIRWPSGHGGVQVCRRFE